MAQPAVNVGVASENGCIQHSSAVYSVKDTAVMGRYSNIPSVEVKSLAVDSLSAAGQSKSLA